MSDQSVEQQADGYDGLLWRLAGLVDESLASALKYGDLLTRATDALAEAQEREWVLVEALQDLRRHAWGQPMYEDSQFMAKYGPAVGRALAALKRSEAALREVGALEVSHAES